MKIDTLSNGSLSITEHLWLARFGLLAFPVAVMGGVTYGVFSGIEIFHPAWGWLAGAALSFVIAALLQDLDIEFDRPRRRVRWRRKRLFWRDGGDIPMDAVKDITIRIEGTDDTQHRRPQYSLVMVTNDETVPLTVRHTTDRSELERAARLIESLLGRSPESDIVERSLDDAIAQGRTIEAVTWLRRRNGLNLTQAKTTVDERRRKD